MKTQELYNSVTNEVIRQLEEGTPPWTRPWKDNKLRGVGMIPSNLITGRLYSGSNVLLLWITAQQRGFDSLQFCTYHQVNGIGAKVKKGEKATHIIFTKRVTKKDEQSDEEKASTIVKTYPVFHLSQLENVPDQYTIPQETYDEDATHEQALQLQQRCGVKTSHGGNKAAYYPQRDEIIMPAFGSFEDENAYWGVWNHEATHATGHKDRLERKYGKRFGDSTYAFEELVAELGSAFLCARLQIPPSFRSASYIESWLKVLKGDNRAILSAASYAGHASDFLWEKSFHTVDDDTPDCERPRKVA